MQRKLHVLLAHVIRLHQAFSTDRTEVAPRSNIVGEDFETDCAHGTNIRRCHRRCERLWPRDLRDYLERTVHMLIGRRAKTQQLTRDAEMRMAESGRPPNHCIDTSTRIA
jgi:hypothetical protein